MDEADPEDRYLAVAPESLSAEALRGLVEEFVSRDGTDYGASERTLEEKVAGVMRQLDSEEVRIVFDRETQVANLVSARDWG